MLRRTVRCEVAVRNSTDDDELELELAAALALVALTGSEAKIAAALGPAAEAELELMPVLLGADKNEENGNRNGNPNRSRQRDQRFVASSRCCYSWCSVEQLDQHGAEPVGRKRSRRHGSLGTSLFCRGALGNETRPPGRLELGETGHAKQTPPPVAAHRIEEGGRVPPTTPKLAQRR